MCTKCCVLAVGGADNAYANSRNIIFTINGTKLYIPIVTLLAEVNQKLSKFLPKYLKSRCIGMNIKQKARIKIPQTSIDISSNQTL